jgi:hypothetical protein
MTIARSDVNGARIRALRLAQVITVWFMVLRRAATGPTGAPIAGGFCSINEYCPCSACRLPPAARCLLSEWLAGLLID